MMGDGAESNGKLLLSFSAPDLQTNLVADQVVDAMRQTVTNMLGTLPPQFFQVTISTVSSGPMPQSSLAIPTAASAV